MADGVQPRRRMVAAPLPVPSPGATARRLRICGLTAVSLDRHASSRPSNSARLGPGTAIVFDVAQGGSQSHRATRVHKLLHRLLHRRGRVGLLHPITKECIRRGPAAPVRLGMRWGCSRGTAGTSLCIWRRICHVCHVFLCRSWCRSVVWVGAEVGVEVLQLHTLHLSQQPCSPIRTVSQDCLLRNLKGRGSPLTMALTSMSMRCPPAARTLNLEHDRCVCLWPW
jgi:hypothetical protein